MMEVTYSLTTYLQIRRKGRQRKLDFLFDLFSNVLALIGASRYPYPENQNALSYAWVGGTTIVANA